MQCHTSLAAIINYLGKHYQDELVSEKKNVPSSILLDGSNETGSGRFEFHVIFSRNDFNFDWKYVTGIVVDNTNSNIGAHNSIASRTKQKMQIFLLRSVRVTCH